jgi:hypothetical protein
MLDFNLNIDEMHHAISDHGAIFDDGRRWCGICKSPKLVCKPSSEPGNWATKSCPRCLTIWPEYEHEYALSADDMENEIVWSRIH